MPYDPFTKKRLPYPGEPGYTGEAAPAISQFGGGIPGGGQFSPELSAYMMEQMPAITQQEQEMEFNTQRAKSLREGAPKRMDWASQLARAGTGAAEGQMDAKILQGIGEMQKQRKGYYGGAAEIVRREAAAAAQAAQRGKNVVVDEQNPLTRNPFE